MSCKYYHMRRLKCSLCGKCRHLVSSTASTSTIITRPMSTVFLPTTAAGSLNTTRELAVNITAPLTTRSSQKVERMTQIIAVYVSFNSPQHQNSVFNTSYGPIAANLPEFAVYAQASYVERLEYTQHKFKMTFNIQNGTDLDSLRQSAIEKCALAFEDNRDFVDCQIINLDVVNKHKSPRHAVVSSNGQFNARLIQLIAMTVTSTFQGFGASNSTHTNLAYQLTEEIELIDVIENLSLIPLKRIQMTHKNFTHPNTRLKLNQCKHLFDLEARRWRTQFLCYSNIPDGGYTWHCIGFNRHFNPHQQS